MDSYEAVIPEDGIRMIKILQCASKATEDVFEKNDWTLVMEDQFNLSTPHQIDDYDCRIYSILLTLSVLHSTKRFNWDEKTRAKVRKCIAQRIWKKYSTTGNELHQERNDKDKPTEAIKTSARDRL